MSIKDPTKLKMEKSQSHKVKSSVPIKVDSGSSSDDDLLDDGPTQE